jgi:uncharacterized membrane protein YidH (DUF202 family)
VSRRRADRTLIAAGLVTIALGTLLLLDRLEVLDVRFGYTMPAVLAAVGIVLLVAGLCNVDRRSPAETRRSDGPGEGAHR